MKKSVLRCGGKSLAALLAGLMALAAPVLGQSREASLLMAPEPYSAPQKPLNWRLGQYDSRAFIELKYVQGSGVRLREGALQSDAQPQAVASVRRLLARGALRSVERLFHGDEASLEAISRRAKAASNREQADLNLWYRLALTPGEDIAALVNALNADPAVEIAYPAPLAAPPPTQSPSASALTDLQATPDFSARQTYRNAASVSGVDALYGNTIAGGTGNRVRVADVEYGWNANHEDLSKLRLPGAAIRNGTPTYSFVDHGTAVMGEIGGDNNGFGVTGIAYGATLHYSNVNNTERGYDAANAILAAVRVLGPGDVILIEQQTGGPSGCSGYVALEWIPSVYDAIVVATSAGIHVVEAAGNGAMNLDNSSCFGSPFPRSRANSGAIIVGAGAAYNCGSTPRSRLSYSTYGSRVDLQGWGQCVTSTGYADLYGPNSNATYTSSFSGTSSASPIVTGAVAVLSSVAEERGLSLTPAALRAHLVATGSPQVGSGKIGPLPNIKAAIENLSGGGNPDFTFNLAPASATLTAGQSITVAVSTASSASTPPTLSLSASGQPSGVSVSFEPSTVLAGQNALMTVSTTTNVVSGSYPLTVRASAGAGSSRELSFILTIAGAGGGCNDRSGTLASGAQAIEPGGTWYQTSSSGTHRGCIKGPAGSDFDLYFQKWNGSSWNTVASSTSSGPDESINYNGSAGYYRYLVRAYRGSGSYSFGNSKP